MPSRKRTASSLLRRLLLAAWAVLPAASWAAKPVPVFEVDVAGQTPAALRQAMRAALVRATGRQEAASDPAFAGLIADAPKYVAGYQRGAQGEMQVVFNSAAVAQAIAAAGRSLWDPVRPFTLIVISPPADEADQANDDAQLEQAAQARGLPISIVPLPVTDSSGNLLPRAALLAMAHRYGADELLIGTPPAQASAAPSAPQGGLAPPPASAPPASPPPSGAAAAAAPGASGPSPGSSGAPGQQWQWTLETDFISQSWSGAITTGVDRTVDLLAPSAGPAAQDVTRAARIEIDGVDSLADYANIELMLPAVPGVSAANVVRVDGTRVVFDLTARGGEAAVARALAASPRFAPAAGAGALPVFRYRPD
jgi:hypothetical protein